MKIVVFGLSITSAWGNGHATLLRGLFRALRGQCHEVDFFERDAAYYAAHRDAPVLPYVTIHLYSDWQENLRSAQQALQNADVAIVTSYCPDGAAASELLTEAKAGLQTVFYDMDTPVTLDRLARGEAVPYLPSEGLRDFDLVLSYTGGRALTALRQKLGARNVATLYGWVDPEVYYKVPVFPAYESHLSYLGTYSADRQKMLQELLLNPARQLPDRTFVIGGAMYPNPEFWPRNVRYFSHVPPLQHSAFYSSSPLTLNVTRGTMAAMGHCPSGRLFEAAACGTAVLSDRWDGLETFFTLDQEILTAASTAEAIAALIDDRAKLAKIGSRAKERTLDCHTAAIRARRLISLIEACPHDPAISSAVAGEA